MDEGLQALERPDHDLESGDPIVLVPFDQVHPVDVDPVEFGDEFEYCRIRGGVPLTDVMESGVAAEHGQGRAQVGERHGFTLLRGENRGGQEYGVVGDECVECLEIVRLDHAVPAVDDGWAVGGVRHVGRLSVADVEPSVRSRPLNSQC